MRLSNQYRYRCFYDCGRPIAGYGIITIPKWFSNVVYGMCADCISETKDFELVATTLEEAQLYAAKSNL